MTEELTIEDLEKHSGLSVRTLHYYMAEGLLPGPDKRGKFASYSQEHLDRLDLILILKELHLPLKDIRVLLESLTPAEIQHYLDDQEDLLANLKAAPFDKKASTPDTESSSALEYIKGLEEAHGKFYHIREDQNTLFRNQTNLPLQPRLRVGADRPSSEPRQEIWRHVTLADGVELHIRDTYDKETLTKVERLRAFARSLFKA